METPTNRTTMQTSKTSFARSIGSITSTDGCDHNGDVATTGSLTNTRKSGIRHSKSKIQDNCIRRTSCGTEVSSKNQRSLSHEQMACLKTALAVVVIKRRYQENQEMNEDSRGKKKNYNSDTRDPTLKLKDNQPELKINGVGLNGHSIDSSRQIISTTRSYPASSNLTKGDKLPYIVSSSCWHDHLHHLMQLARSTCEQLHNEKTYQSQPSKKEQQNNRYLLERFDGLATHLVCQLEHLQSCVASSNYGKVAISSSLEDTSGKHMKENKTSRGAIDIDDGANASNPKECNLTIGKDDKIDGDDAGSDDDARKFPPSIIELNKWILFHLTLSSLNDQSKYTNSIPKKYSNHCCDEVDPFVGLLVPFYPVWRKLLSLKPITISRLLVPVLLQLIIPHTIQYKLFHGTKMKAESNYFDIDCCYYWYILLKEAIFVCNDDTIRKLTIEQLTKYTEPMTSVCDLAHRYFKGMNCRNNPSWLSTDATIGTRLLLEIALSDILQYLMSESFTNQPFIVNNEKNYCESKMFASATPNCNF